MGLANLLLDIQWEPEQLAAMQAEALRKLVHHALSHSSFYRGRLGSVVQDQGFDPEFWSSIPTFERAEAHARREELFARELPPESLGFVEDETAGSTGTPFAHRTSKRATIMSRALGQRVYEDFGVDPAQTLADIRIPRKRTAEWPEGARASGWHQAEPDSTVLFLDVGTNVERQLDWLRRNSPAFLTTYPSNALALAEHVLATDDPSVVFSHVFTIGGNLTEDMRARIADAFGCRVVNLYGCQEMGLIATECPEGHGLHVCAESVLLEILREDDTPVPAGETGRVVLTSLHNYAMPLIRYAVGDYAALHDGPCPCGRALPLLTKIYGRSANQFVFPDGSRRMLGISLDEIRRCLGFESLQIVQHATDEIEVRYIPLPDNKLARREDLETYFRTILNPEARLRLSPLSALERETSGKFEILKCLIGRDEV
jgi:phenylacetate-CoA ligase